MSERRASVPIPRWPEGERPRERLYQKGADSLSDAELLALLLGTGAQGKTAVDLAHELLALYGSLQGLSKRGVSELASLRGVGRAKAVRLVAAVEISRRIRSNAAGEKPRFSSPEEVAAYYVPRMEDLKKEVFRVALLDSQNGFIKDVVISEGSLQASIVHPREVFNPAVVESAAAILLVHNHPSGDPTPSKEDIQVTRLLVEAGQLLQIRVHDHVIIGSGKWVSLAQKGVI